MLVTGFDDRQGCGYVLRTGPHAAEPTPGTQQVRHNGIAVLATAAPRPPRTRKAASAGADGASPTKLSIRTETTGPTMTSSLGRHRSARASVSVG